MVVPTSEECMVTIIKKENSCSSESSSDTVILDSDGPSQAIRVNRKRKFSKSNSLILFPSDESTCSDISSKKIYLPNLLQLPENIPQDIEDILMNKPYHPAFYQARVKLVKKAREFFSGICPYPSAEEYIEMIKCIGGKFPHLSDPGCKETDPPRTKFVSIPCICRNTK